MKARGKRRTAGFSLVELMTALAIFMIISGVAFTLLASSMKNYQSESDMLSTQQEARFGLDQMIRDISNAGYPPKSIFSTLPPQRYLYTEARVAWSPNYPTTPCQMEVDCLSPGDFDIMVEGKTDTLHTSQSHVKWIRYKLVGNTLMRGEVDKDFSNDPLTTSGAAGTLVPYVQNVVNNASAADIAGYQAAYPGAFPAGTAIPIFTYQCDGLPTSSVPLAPVACKSGTSLNTPDHIRTVGITLIVATPFPDARTGLPRLVEMQGRARIISPQ